MSRTPDVPGYHLVDRLHRGPRADVWRASRADDGRPVAVKIPAPGPDGADTRAEATILERARHPNLLGVVERVRLDDGRECLVTDLADGGSLATLVAARGRLTAGEAAAILAPVADALWSLHRSGIVHGDLAPGNVLLTASARPLLADLGAGREDLADADGAVWGTTGQVAPELLAGGTPTPESDLFALGALVVHALTGTGVAPLESTDAVLARCATETSTPLPDELVELVRTLLDGDPAGRGRAIAASRTLAAVAAPESLDIGGRGDGDLVTHRVRAAARAALAAEPVAPARGDRLRAATGTRSFAVLRAVALLAIVFVGSFYGTRLVTGHLPGASTTRVVAAPGVATTAAPAPSSPVVAPTAAATTAATTSIAPDAATDPGAAKSRPADVLAAILARRANALEQADSAALVHVDAPSSWAHERDLAILDQLGRRQEKQQGLRFVVSDATVVSASATRTLVEAHVARGPYSWSRPSANGIAPAAAPVAGRYTLVWFDGRWVVEKVEPA